MRSFNRLLHLSAACLVGMAVVACGGGTSASPSAPPVSATSTPAAAETPAPKPQTVTIGFTTSQTGKLNVESTRQQDGLQLWMKDVNAAGGVPLSDGTVLTFEAKTYDDESSNDRIQELYTKLINDDNADFLISPYSSGLADTSAVIAEQYSKIMITTGAASDGTYKKGYLHVYQAYTPASAYLTGGLDLFAKLDSGAKKIAIVHENDKFSSDVASALTDYATSKGYDIVVNEGYDSGATDFASFINKIDAASPDAIMGGGHFADTSTFAKQLYEKGVKAKMVALLVAPPEPTFADIGDAALGVVGPSQWEPTVGFSEAAAATLGVDWLGPTVADFVSSYKAAYGEDPSYHSAGGYAAGLILQAAIQAADSVDTDKVKSAMDSMDLMTFFGQTKFDTSAEAHGLQAAHSMVYIQWQTGSSGLEKQVVWPEAAKTADALYPIP
jgi:ABC-type branched-subunit amino acid transport system substrate-binding protein